MKKILAKIITSLLIGGLILTSVLNIDLVAKTFAMGGNVNELGIDSTVMYNSDNTSAVLGVDLSNLDQGKYEVKEILGPEGQVLEQSNPSIRVNDNAEYILKVYYFNKTDVTNDEVAIAEEQLTPIEVLEPELKEIMLLTPVTKIIKTKGLIQENVNSSKQNFSLSSPRIGETNSLNDIFNVDDGKVFLDTYGTNTIPWKDSVNINSDITGNVFTTLNPVEGVENTTMYWNPVGPCWMMYSFIDSKTPINTRASWTMKGKVQLSKAKNGNISTGVRLTKNNGMIVGLDIESKISENKARISIGGQNTYPNGIVGDSSYFNTEREIVMQGIYNGDETVTYSITVEGQRLERTFNISDLGENLKMQIYGLSGWSYHDDTQPNKFPAGPNRFSFDSLKYNNFNPVFEGLKWYDSKGIEVDENSHVMPGEELTVKVKVKNESTSPDIIPMKLFLSDDDTKAITKGIEATGELITGIPINLTKDAQEVSFKVTVKDTIGDIALGLCLEDDFFHEKRYKQVESKMMASDIFADGTPTYTIMEYKRDSSGNIVKDISGNPTFVEAKNQSVLTQDSFVKVDAKLENPRVTEVMTTTMKADLSKVPGLDFDNINNFEIVNGIGTAADLDTGLIFTLAENKGTGSFSYIVPVKQNADGTPFNMDEQTIDYTVDGSFIHLSEGLVKGTWNKSTIVSDANEKPIKDINVSLITEKIELERNESFNLLQTDNPLLTFTPSIPEVSADFDEIALKNQGTLDDWKIFGLTGDVDNEGKISITADDGTEMQTNVQYNQVILLNGEKHYTRLGLGDDPAPRTKTSKVILSVNGGEILPVAYFEIPERVLLKGEQGIDDTYAGSKITIGIKDSLNTKLSFDVSADTDFKIKNENGIFHIVSLFNEDKTEMTKVGSIANVTTFNTANPKKVIWFNTKKDKSKRGSYYEGKMMFYFTLK